ncbi:MAG: hypothetical protein AAF724_20210 [Pseudomonadota bacterium]
MTTRLLVLLFAILAAAPAFAINQYDISNRTCSEVQSILQRDGQAQLRYPAPDNPGITLYGRYISSGRYCRPTTAFVPTRDTRNCRVQECLRTGGGGGR